MLYLMNKMKTQDAGPEVERELLKELAHRESSDRLFESLFGMQSDEPMIEEPTDMDCLRLLVDTHD